MHKSRNSTTLLQLNNHCQGAGLCTVWMLKLYLCEWHILFWYRVVLSMSSVSVRCKKRSSTTDQSASQTFCAFCVVIHVIYSRLSALITLDPPALTAHPFFDPRAQIYASILRRTPSLPLSRSLSLSHIFSLLHPCSPQLVPSKSSQTSSTNRTASRTRIMASHHPTTLSRAELGQSNPKLVPHDTETTALLNGQSSGTKGPGGKRSLSPNSRKRIILSLMSLSALLLVVLAVTLVSKLGTPPGNSRPTAVCGC